MDCENGGSKGGIEEVFIDKSYEFLDTLFETFTAFVTLKVTFPTIDIFIFKDSCHVGDKHSLHVSRIKINLRHVTLRVTKPCAGPKRPHDVIETSQGFEEVPRYLTRSTRSRKYRIAN